MKLYLLILLVLIVPLNLNAGDKNTKAFWILTAANYASAVADIELTQACLRNNTCYEGNPLLPSGRKEIYAIQMGLATLTSIISYRWMKDDSKYWYVPQVAIISAHGVGITFGLRFQF
jgi:hypothetical protein